MKKTIAILIAMLSLNAFSQVIYLDSTDINLEANGATLIKTASTPKNVTLNLLVPTNVERCDSADRVTATNAARCGTDTEYYPCPGVRIGSRYPRVGPRYMPPGHRPPGQRPTRISIPAGRRYNPANDIGISIGLNQCSRQVPRTCTYCVNPYYVTVDLAKTFNLTFERFTKDATIDFNLDQHGNLVLDVTGVAPGCIKKVIYGGGKNITGAKLKLKRSCR